MQFEEASEEIKVGEDAKMQVDHPGHLLRCRSSQRRFTRRLLGHRVSHLIAKYERHVTVLALNVRSRNVRSLPLHCRCPLP